MRIRCTKHAMDRLAERFGVRWDQELEDGIVRQLVESPGPVATAGALGRKEDPTNSYWEVKIDGMAALLVITETGRIVSVMRPYKSSDRPKKQKRRHQKKYTLGSRPVAEVPDESDF